jgi:hypothetical protein
MIALRHIRKVWPAGHKHDGRKVILAIAAIAALCVAAVVVLA